MTSSLTNASATGAESLGTSAHPRGEARLAPGGSTPKMRTTGLTVRYGETVAVHDVNLDVRACEVLALIGPSGCGKSTFLRSLNRMNDTVAGVAIAGRVELDGASIYGADVDPVLVRQRVGMVFQRSNPFPKSIFENVAYGASRRGHPRLPNGVRARGARLAPGGPLERGERSPLRIRPSGSRVGSNSDSASLAPSPWSPRCC